MKVSLNSMRLRKIQDKEEEQKEIDNVALYNENMHISPINNES